MQTALGAGPGAGGGRHARSFFRRASVAAAAKQQNVLGDDVGRVDLLAVLVIVAAGLETALHVDLLALREIVGEIFLAPDCDIRPVVSSFHSPLCWSFQRRVVARGKRVTDMPEGVNFVSASRPRFPMRMTLFTLRAMALAM